MALEAGGLVEEGGRDEGNAGGPGGHESRPGHARLADDDPDGRHAGEIEQHEQQIGEGTDPAVEAGLHGPEGPAPHRLLRRHLRAIREIPQVQPQWIEQAGGDRGQVFRHGAGRRGQGGPEVEGLRGGRRLFLLGDSSVEGIQGTDDDFFSENPGDDPDHGRPVVLPNAQGGEQGRCRSTHRAQHRVLAVGLAQGAVGADGAEQIQGHHHEDDDPPGLLEEQPHPVPGPQHHAFEGRQVVRGKLHHEAGALACEQGPLHHQSGQDRHQNSDQVEGEDHVLPRMREEGGGEEHIDR